MNNLKLSYILYIPSVLIVTILITLNYLMLYYSNSYTYLIWTIVSINDYSSLFFYTFTFLISAFMSLIEFIILYVLIIIFK